MPSWQANYREKTDMTGFICSNKIAAGARGRILSMSWQCPHCENSVDDELTECPNCGWHPLPSCSEAYKTP